MNTADKRKNVIETLETTSDEQLIDEVYELLHPEESVEEVDTQNLPSELRQKINAALDDYHSGRYISHAEMKQKVQQWLMK